MVPFMVKRASGEGPRNVHPSHGLRLLKYQNKTSSRIEWVWNAQTSEAPFLIRDPEVSLAEIEAFQKKVEQGLINEKTAPHPAMMALSDLQESVIVPNYVPPIGSRIILAFRNLSVQSREIIQHTAIVQGRKSVIQDDECFCIYVDEPTHHVYSKLARDNPFAPFQGRITPH